MSLMFITNGHSQFLSLHHFSSYQEVNSVLQQVVERNRVRRSLSAKRHALQSWRSLVETILTACPAELIPADQRQLIIRDLLLDLHDKVLHSFYLVFSPLVLFSLENYVPLFKSLEVLFRGIHFFI